MKPPAKPQPGIAQFRRPGPQQAAQRHAAPNYHVQPPVHMSGRQQIRATISGTPQVAGSINLSPRGGGKAFVSDLQVDQQHRRRGVAAKLIEAAVSTARRQGFRSVALEARPSDNGISPAGAGCNVPPAGISERGKD